MFMKLLYHVSASTVFAFALIAVVLISIGDAQAENGDAEAGADRKGAVVAVPYEPARIGARELAEAARLRSARGRTDESAAASYSLSDAMRDSQWRRDTSRRLNSLFGNLSRF